MNDPMQIVAGCLDRDQPPLMPLHSVLHLFKPKTSFDCGSIVIAHTDKPNLQRYEVVKSAERPVIGSRPLTVSARPITISSRSFESAHRQLHRYWQSSATKIPQQRGDLDLD